ncbi:MAG: trehalose-phosphatase [Candidatus Micrarchaeota archaeon]
MNGLFADLGRIIAHHNVILAFDFDGTLSEFTDMPRNAIVSRKMQLALTKAEVDSKIIVISSRNTAFLREKLKFLRNLQIYGLHGLETPTKTKSLSLAEMISLVSLKHSVNAIIENERHAWIEDKPAGFCIHFRGATGREFEKLSLMARKTAENAGFKAYRGARALEVLSKESPTKARILEEIAEAMGARNLLFYFGDDEADEEAFARVRQFKRAITVAIGRKETTAKYSCRDIKELTRLITKISKIIKAKKR